MLVEFYSKKKSEKLKEELLSFYFNSTFSEKTSSVSHVFDPVLQDLNPEEVKRIVKFYEQSSTKHLESSLVFFSHFLRTIHADISTCSKEVFDLLSPYVADINQTIRKESISAIAYCSSHLTDPAPLLAFFKTFIGKFKGFFFISSIPIIFFWAS